MRSINSKYFILLPFFLILLISCSSERKKEVAAKQNMAGKKPPAPRVDGFIVKSQTISESLEVPGTLVSEDATEIHPEVSGRITGLYIREGSYVGKGALLAKLYDADLQAQKRKLEVQLQIAQQTENRHQQLLKIGGISKEDYAATALQVSNLRADLDIINTAIAKTVIRAPFGGRLGLKEISIGSYVTPQTVLANLQKTNDLKIDFSLPEKYTNQIRKGQPVNFSVEGTNNNYTAVIVATNSGIEQASRTLMIRALVKGSGQGLVPGNFAKVKINFDPNPNALMIPSEAIIPQARGKKVILYKGGQASFVDVTTGVRDSSMVQVIQGLNTGDTVVITGLLSVKPEGQITINKIVNKGS